VETGSITVALSLFFRSRTGHNLQKPFGFVHGSEEFYPHFSAGDRAEKTLSINGLPFRLFLGPGLILIGPHNKGQPESA
jgi:hypothetical protein